MRTLAPRVLLAALIVPLVLLVAPEATGAASYRFPNLKTLPPADLVLATAQVDGETHHVLRFTNAVWNAGPGKLELRGATTPQGTTRVHQRVYAGAGRFREWVAGEFAYHEAHAHWHFGDFAEYELWTRAEYGAWVASGKTRGEARERGTKTTFCIIDSMKVRDLRGTPAFRAYDACDETLQGISVGWGDSYPFDLPEQWLDLGPHPLPDGNYVLRSIADPDDRIFESAGKRDRAREGQTANDAATPFEVRSGTITATG